MPSLLRQLIVSLTISNCHYIVFKLSYQAKIIRNPLGNSTYWFNHALQSYQIIL